MSETAEAVQDIPQSYPPGDYAIVELMGHTTLVGRIAEVERFGAKMLGIEPLFNGEFLPVVFQGGASIYRLTQCTAEVAFKHQPKHEGQLPAPIRATVPAALLPAPAAEAETLADAISPLLDSDDDDELEF